MVFSARVINGTKQLTIIARVNMQTPISWIVLLSLNASMAVMISKTEPKRKIAR